MWISNMSVLLHVLTFDSLIDFKCWRCIVTSVDINHYCYINTFFCRLLLLFLILFNSKVKSFTDSIKKRGWNQVLMKRMQFLLLTRHPPCYSYRQSTPVKFLTVIEERKHLRKKIKDPLLFEIWIFVTVNQIVMTVKFL